MLSNGMFVFLLTITPLLCSANIQLYEHLFKNYHKEIRPSDPENPVPTNVTVQLFLKQIQNVVESDQIISLYCWIEMYWRDLSLQWEAADFNGTAEIIVPASMIWRPDLLVYNNAHMNVEDSQLETNAVIKNDGRVSVYRAMVTEITCVLVMDEFPFDQQVCYIMLASWSYDGSAIMLDTLTPTDEDNKQTDLSRISTLTHYMENQEWYLNDFKIRRNLKFYECCPHPFPDLTYYFSIRRNPMYYLFTQLLPSTFISVITLIGSFTPHHTTGENQEKISLGSNAGVAIVIILMLIADKLPATSNTLPLLGRFYVGLIFVIFSATCSTTFVMHIQMKGNNGRRVPSWFIMWIRRSRFLRLFFGRLVEDEKKLCKKGGECSCWSRGLLNGAEPLDYRLNRKLLDSHYYSANPSPHPLSAHPLFHRILSAINEIRQANERTVEHWEEERRLVATRREWEILARGLDRLLLFAFISFTVLYDLYILSLMQTAPLLITEEFMNRTSARA